MKKRSIIFSFFLFFFLLLKINAQNEKEQLYLLIDKEDSLIEKEISKTNENTFTKLKVYDEKLIEEKKGYLKKSLFLPQGFSEYYYFLVSDKGNQISLKDFNKLRVLERKEFLNKFHTKYKSFIIEKDDKGYCLYEIYLIPFE